MFSNIDTVIKNIGTDKSMPCTRAWTSLEERSLSGDIRICCFINSEVGMIDKESDTDILSLWNNSIIKSTREAFADGTFMTLCPDDCPVLVKKRRLEPDSTDFYDYDPSEYNTFSKEFRDNREKIIESIINRDLTVDAFPLRLKLHPSNTCNLRCSMCPQDKSLKKDIGGNYVHNLNKLMPYLEELLIFGGEPFACRFTRDIIFGDTITKYPQIHYSTITNGTLLDNNILEKLKHLRLGWFSFSLDSCSKKIYERMRLNASYDKTFSNLENFVRARDKGDISIHNIEINFTIQKENFYEIADFVKYAHDMGISVGFGFVTGSYELYDKMDEVKSSIGDALSLAENLNDTKTVKHLTYLVQQLPSYSAQIKKLRLYFKLSSFAGKEWVVDFVRRHNGLKLFLKKIVRL